MLKNGKNKILTIGLILLMTIGLFSSCGQGENSNLITDDQKLTWNISSDPENIDPTLSISYNSSTIIKALFEGLTKLDNNGNIIPGVAESFPIISEDGLNYKFKIRDDAKWSDGKNVSSKDFVYSIRRALTLKSSNYIFELFNIKNAKSFHDGLVSFEEVGVKADDDLSLEITLENPAPYFLELLSHPIFMPLREDVISKIVDDSINYWTYDPKTCISNGPFKLKRWIRNDKIEVIKNEEFFNAENVKLQEITFKIIEDKKDAIYAFKNGEIDFIEKPPTSEIIPLTDESLYKVFPIIGTYYLILNQSPEFVNMNPDYAKVLKDVRIRRALSLAIDRQSIIDVITMSGEKPALSLVPSVIKDDKGRELNDNNYLIDNDIQEAKRLLREVGYPNGKNFPRLQYIYTMHSSNENNENIAKAIQSMWRDNLGINIELIGINLDSIENVKNSKEYLITNESEIGNYMDASIFLLNFYSKSEKNHTGYNNPLFDKKIEASMKETDTSKRIELLKDCESILMEDSIVIPIFFHTLPTAIKPYVKNVIILPTGAINFENIYIDKTKKLKI